MGLIMSIAAIAAGVAIGMSVGLYLYSAVAVPQNLDFLDESMDMRDDMLPPEDGARVGKEMHQLLANADAWASLPDFERVLMVNRVIKVMWPMLQKGILERILRHTKQPFNNRLYRRFSWFEDIIFGAVSSRDVPRDYGALLEGREFDFGTTPPRLGGMKVYAGIEDEAVLEANVQWASNCKFDMGVFLRLFGFRLWIPLHLSRLVVRATMRVSFIALNERLPCLGGIKLNMLGPPTLAFGLSAGGINNVMAVPLLGSAIYRIAQNALQRLFIYPNRLQYQISRPNYGQLPSPQGALQVRLLRADNVRYSGDTYVEMWVREGRKVRSKTVRDTSNPTYEEDFCLIVDDVTLQDLHIRIMDDTLGWNDVILGHGSVAFANGVVSGASPGAGVGEDQDLSGFAEMAPFIREPATCMAVEVDLLKPRAKNLTLKVAHHASVVAKLGAQAIRGAQKTAKMSSDSVKALANGVLLPSMRHISLAGTSSPGGGSQASSACESRYGRVYLEVTFIPFPKTSPSDKQPAPVTPRPGGPPAPPVRIQYRVNPRNVLTSLHAEMQGVLTITLVRCMNLVPPKKGKGLKVYVRFTATDETSAVVQTSRPVFHELSPRWGDKLDFVLVKASAVLRVAVFNRVSALGHLLKMGHKADGENDVAMGQVNVPVADVVRNGRLRNIFTLQDIEHGAIELAMEWTTIHSHRRDTGGA